MTDSEKTHIDGTPCPEGQARVPPNFNACCDAFNERTLACYYDIRYEWWEGLQNWFVIIFPEAGGGGVAFGFCPHCGTKLTLTTESGRFMDFS